MTTVTVAIDTNLLLLYVVGSASRKYVSMHKRLKTFDEDDFDLLVEQVTIANRIILTPNTLTETSNWIDHIAEPARGHIYNCLAALLAVPEVNERYVPSLTVCERMELPRLGLADCTLLEVARTGVPIITTDLHLYLAAEASGARAINFNHLRDARSPTQ
jgi:hypothetical protein